MAHCERIARIDPTTGAKILQLTSFPVTHCHLGLGDFIAPDGSKFLLSANRFAGRNSPRDLYSIHADGSEFCFLLEDPSGGVLSPDARWVYTGQRGAVVRLPFEGGKLDTIFVGSEYDHIMVSARSQDGRSLFAQGRRIDNGTFELMRVDLGTGASQRIVRASYIMPVLRSRPNGERLVASIAPIGDDGKPSIPWGVWEFSSDGQDFLSVPFSRSTNHYTPMGDTGSVVTTAAHPGNALDIAEAGGKERILAQGAGFWHVSSDASGEWLAADTNWPDVGLQLVHAPSGRFGVLCHTGASAGHPQWTHAHPVISPDARWVLYTSDQTGISQVYLVEIPDELKSALRDGQAT
jgi:hypothetical protein